MWYSYEKNFQVEKQTHAIKNSSFTAPSKQQKVKITMNPIHHILQLLKQKENKTFYSLLKKKKRKTNNKIM